MTARQRVAMWRTSLRRCSRLRSQRRRRALLQRMHREHDGPGPVEIRRLPMWRLLRMCPRRARSGR